MRPWFVLLYSAITGLKLEKGLGTGLGLVLWIVFELKADLEMWPEPGGVGWDVGPRLGSEPRCAVLSDGPEVGSTQELETGEETQPGQR